MCLFCQIFSQNSGESVTDTSVLSCPGPSQLQGFTVTHGALMQASAGQVLEPGFLGKSG